MDNLRQWYVVYTKANAEKKFADKVNRLHGQSEAYVPLIEQQRQWSDRVKTISVPLFKSYVFVYVDGNEYQAIKRLSGFVNYVRFNNEPAVLSADELAKIRLLITSKRVSDALPNRLVVGNEVEIIGGSLQGYRGILMERRSQKLVAIKIHGLDQSILITAPIELLKPVE